jgi:acetoacetate decarboxylase
MRQAMKIDDVRKTAYSMPLTNPSFPPGPYRFFNREYFVITYRTDPEALAAVVPEPLEVTEPVVKYEFIRMPDSTGFGDYTETGQVIPVRLNGEDGAYTHAMYLDDDAPIAGGRELWGAGVAEDRSRERRPGGIAALRFGALRLRHHGLQAPSGRS